MKATGVCHLLILHLLLGFSCCTAQQQPVREIDRFTEQWRFHLGDLEDGQNPALDDSNWRMLNLPHDWSIEGSFKQDHPAGVGGGALPGGIGWYRKSFTLPKADSAKLHFIDFDGVYRESEVWIKAIISAIGPMDIYPSVTI